MQYAKFDTKLFINKTLSSKEILDNFINTNIKNEQKITSDTYKRATDQSVSIDYKFLK